MLLAALILFAAALAVHQVYGCAFDRRGNLKVCAFLGPGARQIGAPQRLALVGKQQHDVAGVGLRLEQFQAQTAAVHRRGVVAALQRVAGSAIAKAPFLRSAVESCDFEILTPSCAAI
jgi:hypothetical protein